MKFQQRPVFGFTTRYNGVANVLTNQISVCEAFDPNRGDPETIKKQFTCIWDTGATNTVISTNVINALSLKPSGRTIVHTVGEGGKVNEYEVNTYLVNIYLPNNVMIIGAIVAEGGISGGDLLIGMDIINMGDFAITNYEGQTCLSFRTPSVGQIDFVKEIDEFNFKNRHLNLSEDEKRRLKNRLKRERRQNR
jgi:hypothetical protein